MTLPEPGSVVIRPAGAADLPAVGRLGALLVRMHHGWDPVRFLSATEGIEELYASYLGSQLSDQRKLVLVAEQNAAVVGYAYAGLEGPDYMALRGPAGALYDIVVDPAHRERGTGRRLLDATVAALEARGAPMVVLSTAQQNEPAQRLFARAGFRPTMIEMTKELTRA
jgi:ribosomal protein S18 acetylase RimI-like enzyme